MAIRVVVDGVERDATPAEEADIQTIRDASAARPPPDRAQELEADQFAFLIDEIAATNGESVDAVKARYRTFVSGR